ncbi:hypothetical protein V6N13_096478 [Hibiscus sabdariffa]|uniref:DEK-C domain-containing protein n=1 Tax=Hibiscus sabdariffa TaxID=183260 RepID=A0ABR2DH89_9ROSI
METEALGESKPVEEAAPVIHKEEVKQEKEKEEEEEESKEVSEKQISRESEEKNEVEEKAEETREEDEKEDDEEEGTKEAKGSGRKRSSRKPNRDSAGKKEPVTPSSDRPTRERKVVERYSVPSVARSSTPKPLSIEKGPGTQLKDIPNVAFMLSKRKFDDNLLMLHMILFGKKAKPQRLKRNIGQFSGYVWAQNEREKQKAKVKEKIDKCVKEKLVDFCDLLNIPITRTTVRKEELSVKLLEFLESPHATTDILLADKEQKGKKRVATPSKNIASGEASAKKRRSTPKGGGKRKRLSEDEEKDEDVEPPVHTDDSHEGAADTTLKEESDDEESDDEETKSKEEEDEAKKSSNKSTLKKTATDRPDSKLKETSASGKKATPAKSSRKSSESTSKQSASGGDRTPGSKLKGSVQKMQKVEKESSSDVRFSTKNELPRKKQTTKSPTKVSTKTQGKGKSGKKRKAEPSRGEIHAVVVEILKQVDFNTATLSDILRQLATHFDLDLMHRKAEVKDIVTEAINNMSDDEGEGSEENAGDADKDGNGDDDA